MNNYNNGEQRIAYMGGDPVRCPRCSNVVSTRFCPFCSLDLSTVYSKLAPQQTPLQQTTQQTMPPQDIAQIPQEEIIATYIYPLNANQPPVNPQQGQQYNPPQYNPYNNMQPQPPFNPQYPYFAPTHKTKKGSAVLIIILSALLVFSLVFLGLQMVAGMTGDIINNDPFGDGFSPPQKQEDFLFSGGVSSTEYNKLKVGMSYAQVSSIIGGDGEIVNNGETLKKEKYYVYCWYGETNPNAVVYITITDDAVSDISLEGTL